MMKNLTNGEENKIKENTRIKWGSYSEGREEEKIVTGGWKNEEKIIIKRNEI